ncbi:hypothetical protein [Parasphingopyxis sp.]|uniref:hypothetical protein n=1 Tax=Parasphingopyxis sp. TaxID=1920299 RepID=UPI002610BB24|nr:hypothetical protein [Parasphingopyxis sp.]
MSFLNLKSGSRGTHTGDPFDRPFWEPSPETPEQSERRLRREALLREATAFWQEQLTKLADHHAAAITETVGAVHSFSECALEQKTTEHKRKLKFAYRLLLQQSDTRWGVEITDDALEALYHDADDFRLEAGV